jgi:hypothetical protein
MMGVGEGRDDEGNILPLITEVSSNWWERTWHNKHTLKQPTSSAIPRPRHPEHAAPSEQVLGAEFSRWISEVLVCSTESSPSFDHSLKLTFPKDLTQLAVSEDQ